MNSFAEDRRRVHHYLDSLPTLDPPSRARSVGRSVRERLCDGEFKWTG